MLTTGGAAFGRETDRLLEIFDADLRLAQRRVGRDARELDPKPLAGAADAVGIVEHGDAVEVAGLAEQLAAPMDHRFDVIVAQRGGLFDAPFERFVVVPHEFEIDAQVKVCHDMVCSCFYLPCQATLPTKNGPICSMCSEVCLVLRMRCTMAESG